MKRIEIIIVEQEAGTRLDSLLAHREEGLSRSLIQQLMEKGNVRCNGKTVAKSIKPKAGDRIEVDVPESAPPVLIPQDIPLDIVYEDEHLLVVNKPKGMVVHPAAGNPDGTLVNAVLYHCGGKLPQAGSEQLRPGIVHRIDKETSGLLVVAKDDESYEGLVQQMSVHSVTRVYNAVVYGRVKEDGYVEAPIGRHKTDRKRWL